MLFFQTSKKILLSLAFTCFLLSTTADTKSKKINCRKYVYAPICRGVAAKRSLTDEVASFPFYAPRHPARMIDTVAQSNAKDLIPEGILITRLLKHADLSKVSTLGDYNNLR